MEERLGAIYAATANPPSYPLSSCPGSAHGFQVAVAVLRHVAGPGDLAARAEAFARATHDAWGVGDECGAGVLVLFAIGDRQMYISTGKAAAAKASDATLHLVQVRMARCSSPF